MKTGRFVKTALVLATLVYADGNKAASKGDGIYGMDIC